MAKVIATGTTDTAFAGSTALTVPIPGLNWGVDFRSLSSVPGEVIATNLSSPMDQPETFRFSQRAKANIYAGTDIDVSAYLPTRQGLDTLIECREVWVETDTLDSTYRKLMPGKCGITLSFPAYGNVTPEMVLSLLKRTVAAAFEQGVVTSTGISALQHGVLRKSNLLG